jgi:hypothetical protein
VGRGFLGVGFDVVGRRTAEPPRGYVCKVHCVESKRINTSIQLGSCCLEIQHGREKNYGGENKKEHNMNTRNTFGVH